MVTITAYTMDNLQASPSEGGLACGIFILGALISRIFTGRSIDRVGRKRVLYIGLIFYLITTLFYFVITKLLVLIIIRFLQGAAFGVSATATGTIVASLIPNERRGEGTSYYAMSTTLASAIGPLMGMSLYQHGNFEFILYLSICLLTVGLIAVFFLKVPEIKLTYEQLERTKAFALNNFFESRAIPISLIAAIIGLAYSSVLSFLSSYTREIDLVEAGSLFFLVFSIIILVSRPATGRWFDQKGENFVMYPCFIFFALGLIVLSQTYNGFVLLLAAAFVGLGYGTFLSCAQAISVKVSPPYRMGLATSTYFCLLDAGIGIGPFLLGFLIPWIGFRWLYISMSFVVLVCILLYYFLHGKKAIRTQSGNFYNQQKQLG